MKYISIWIVGCMLSFGVKAQQVVKLLRWLEELDDVQNVYSNAELGDDAYA